jgi:Zn-dependent membrane protease YugP
VEFDASRRALEMVRNAGILSESELKGAKSVLSAAALTYVAATLMAVMQLLYLLSRSRGRRR